jgi:NADPH-dependent ferric siderophore reductase
MERGPNKTETAKDLQVKYREREGETTLEEKREDARISTDSPLFVYIQGESKALLHSVSQKMLKLMYRIQFVVQVVALVFLS